MIDKGTRSKTLNEVKPVENIYKNPQSCLELFTAVKSRAKGTPSFTLTVRPCL